MLSFMFAVLGSILFWATYIPISFVIALLLVKRLNKKVFSTLTDKDAKVSGALKLVSLVLLAGFMVAWPLVIVYYILFHILLNKTVWAVITALASKVSNMVPDVEITFPKNEATDEE